MKYIVWLVTSMNFEEVARFADRKDAETFRDQISAMGDCHCYEITRVGQTPIW